jgi:hypothetical protein
LDKRFTEKACLFVKSVQEAAVKEVIVPPEKLQAPVFQHFKAIYIKDEVLNSLSSSLSRLVLIVTTPMTGAHWLLVDVTGKI